MAVQKRFDGTALKAFETKYDPSREDVAFQARGDFLQAFPILKLKNLTLEDYVIGHKTPTFCTYVEAKTSSWARIQGATARKFGIYYGKTKSDPKKTYRYAEKFGNTTKLAFASVKAALLELVRLGNQSTLDFAAIDSNPLSQMFKAKILSLYYPDRFLNVCSAEHLVMLGEIVGCPIGLPVSQYQHLLLNAKLSSSITRDWSNPKFMAFLYETYVHDNATKIEIIEKPRKKSYRKVNFEDVQNLRNEIGIAAEEFALRWERNRLRGENLENLIPKIQDRRNRPGYGYDYLSHTSLKKPRFIEVKAVGKLPKDEGYRFFLSENEYSVSISDECKKDYYFYLVFFNSKKEPIDLCPVLASHIYQLDRISPASYTVQFDLDHAQTTR